MNQGIILVPLILWVLILSAMTHAQMPSYTLLKVRFQIAENSAPAWETVAHQLQGLFAQCYDASSAVSANNANDQILLAGAQTETQRNSDHCTVNVFEAAAPEIDGVVSVIEFHNNIPICYKEDECESRHCTQMVVFDQFKYCLHNSTPKGSLVLVWAILTLVFTSYSVAL